jgi:RNA-binding protein
MMQLSSGQIRRLRAEGHRLGLKPVVIVGQKGLSDSLHAEIDAALDHHELLKLRIPALGRDARREFGNGICNRHGAVLIESIGGVLVIYRRNPETDRFAAVVGDHA